MIGQSIAHFKITAKIGEGGMGEVYQATDTKLNREVALKVLPESFAQDRQRMGRFQREAQVLASLNHPNIAAIYGLEDADGQKALVMELVEGEDLSERIARGPIPLKEALPIALQIAEALEDAHEKGIVHRDLKPANIKLTSEGKVKVLDFGLAKALEEERTQEDTSNSPTLTMQATQAGIILGTAAYMAPEQARGKPIDRRADIWAFGVVLFEMLAGKQAFEGADLSMVMAAVMMKEPPWPDFPSSTPSRIRDLLERCLRKDPKNRLRDIGDARIEIDDAIAGGPEITTDGQLVAAPPARNRLIFGAAFVLLVGLLVLLGVDRLTRSDAPPPEVARFTVSLPEGERLLSNAISPNGRRLLYVSRDTEQVTRVFIRDLDQLGAVLLPGSDGVTRAFFSPDGQWVVFGVLDALKKSMVSGGRPITLAGLPATVQPIGWGRSGLIVHEYGNQVLLCIPDSGGSATELVRGITTFSSPHFLPDGQTILYREAAEGSLNIKALSLETSEKRTIIEDGDYPHYVSSGHLVFIRSDTILAAPFDAQSLRVKGEAVPVQEDVQNFDVSWNGHLIYSPRVEGAGSELEWMNPSGAATPAGVGEQTFSLMRLSPDGRRVALYDKGEGDIWIHNLERGTLSRFTFEPGEDETPVWSPDGQRIAWSGTRAGQGRGVFVRAADGSGEIEQVWQGSDHVHVDSWSPDGKALLLDRANEDILLLPLDEDRKAVPLLVTQFSEGHPQYSPDGRWIAYVSNESGRGEVYVCPYPGSGGKWRVSTRGGAYPYWSPSGRELYYRNGHSLMAVSVEAGDTFRTDSPRLLFEADFTDYGVAPDGRFLLLQPAYRGLDELRVVLNWVEELKTLVPTE